MTKTLLLSLIGLLLLLGVGGSVWYVFFAPEAPAPLTPVTTPFGSSNPRTSTTEEQPVGVEPPIVSPPATTQKVFLVTQGPIAGATLTQVGSPTTTVARFVKADNGHIFDLPLDSPGTVARSMSNTTIPGVARVLWGTALGAGSTHGSALLMQYIDTEVVKTVYFGFPPPLPPDTIATSSPLERPVRIQFLPDGIVDLAVSPSGAQVVYVLRTQAGADGYIAAIDGSASKKLFTLPLSQVLVAWPSPSTLLVQTKPATGVPGVAFSINTTSGSVVPILYATGLTAKANSNFSHILYQITQGAENVRSSLVRNVQTGLNNTLSFDPSPHQCIWSTASTTTVYCASPLSYVPGNYMDLWHQGAGNAADSILVFTMLDTRSKILATPGARDGGESANIAEFTVSPDEKYLLYIRKGDRSLWGVRI